MRPRKPTGPGAAYKEMQRTAAIRRQMSDERKRHQAKMTDLSMERQQAALRTNPADRSIQIARISAKEVAENERHNAKMSTLASRIYRKS